jgi:hypothetical protein
MARWGTELRRRRGAGRRIGAVGMVIVSVAAEKKARRSRGVMVERFGVWFM